MRRLTTRADPRGRVAELHRLHDGTYVARSRWNSGSGGTAESQDLALVRDSMVLRHMDTALQALDTIAVLPSSESLREINVTSSGQEVVGISIRQTSRPFGRTSYFHPGLSGVVTGNNAFYEWMVRALDGTVQLISRVPDFDRSISTGQVGELRDWFLSNATSPQGTRRHCQLKPAPARLRG